MGLHAVTKMNWKYVMIAVVILAVLMGVFGACSRNGSSNDIVPPNLEQGFTAKANIHFGEIEATADINRIGDGVCNITLISPKALNGMNFQYNGSDIQISYLGMSIKTDDDSLLANAMTSAIVKAVDTAARGSGISMKKSGKTVVLKGENDNGNFELQVDKNTGSLLKLTIPEMDLECTFGTDGGKSK